MATQDFYTLITVVGQAKIANAVALGRTVELSEMAVSDWDGYPTQEQTELHNEVYRGALNSIFGDNSNPNWITAEAVIPQEEGGWYVREIGIYDTDGDLFAVARYPSTYKPVLSGGAGKDLYIKTILEVSNSDVVELKIDPSVVLASREYTDKTGGASRDVSRKVAQDTFGRQLFYGDACKVVHTGGNSYRVTEGPGYVAGIKFDFPGRNISIAEKLNSVWLDVSQNGNPLSVVPLVELVVSEHELTDYFDSKKGVWHYLEKIADLDSQGQMNDLRNTFAHHLNGSITHVSLEDAKRDDNSNRQVIKLLEKGGAPYVRINEDVADKYPPSAKFLDTSEGWWGVQTGDMVFLDYFGVSNDSVVSGTEIQDIFKFCFENDISTIASKGGTVTVSSTIDLYKIFGSRTFTQKFKGYGLTLKVADDFDGDKLLLVGGSDPDDYRVGRHFKIDGLRLDGNNNPGVTAIYNRKGQEFSYDNIRVERFGVALAFEDTYYGAVSGTYSWFEACDLMIEVVESRQISNISFTNIKFAGRDAPSVGEKNSRVLDLKDFCAGLNFTNCTVEGFKHFIDSTSTKDTNGIARHLVVERCYFESNYDSLIKFTNTTPKNGSNNFVVFQDNYLNDPDDVVLEVHSGSYTVKNNGFRQPKIIVDDTTYRTFISHDLLDPITYKTDGTTGTCVEHQLNGWRYGKSIDIGFNELQDYDKYPKRFNTLPTYVDTLNAETVHPLNGVRSNVYSVNTAQYKDVVFIDGRSSVVLRDALDNEFYSIRVRGGELHAEKVSPAERRGKLAPRHGSISARTLYQMAHNNECSDGQEFVVAETGDVKWTGNQLVSATNGHVVIGTTQELLDSSVAPHGYDQAVYNVEIDELWSTTPNKRYREFVTNKPKTGQSFPSDTRVGFIFFKTDENQHYQWNGEEWKEYKHKLPWVV